MMRKPSPLIPAQAGNQRKKTAGGRQNLARVPLARPAQHDGGLRPNISRWIPASAGMSGR